LIFIGNNKGKREIKMEWSMPAALKYFLPQIITGDWVGEKTYIGPERRKFHNIRRGINELTPYLKETARLLKPDSLRGLDEALGRQFRSLEKAERSGGRLSPEAVVHGYSNLTLSTLPKRWGGWGQWGLKR
jgi:hypothetical protein